jgi:hypothetical protein
MTIHTKIASPLSRTTTLVSVRVSQWTARKLDKEITDETNKRHNASKDAGRYNKLLIDAKHLAEINKIVGEARKLHYTLTRPWLDEGTRILPNVLYSQFTDEFRVLKRRFQLAVDAFVAGYPAFIEERKVALNGAFKESDYPSVNAIRSKFALDIVVLPFPDSDDFRSNLPDEVVNDIKQEIAETGENAVTEAMKATFQQIVDLVGHMSTKLHEYDPYERVVEGEKRKHFRDSLVTNVRDLAELLPAFNLTNDPRLTKVTDRIVQELCAEDAQVLRDSEFARDAVAKSADEIVAEVEKFFG